MTGMDHSAMGHDMSGMDHSAMGHDMSGMGHMMMSMGTFHWSNVGEALFLDAWVPKSEPAYIGACFGLMFFAVLSRALMALETYFAAWRTIRAAAASKNITSGVALQDSEKHNDYPEPMSNLPTVPPFNWLMDPARSFMTTVSSFVSYLLMMVVMTGNGGYFVSILGGIFIGELLFGRFRSLGGLHDDHQH
ncbi:hypothetical protein EC973_003710 [Apophysomyces ossiformis]|uniref:Copper transport protein n=1 Tax=Apophysomyces ossiformis TaxID=679940 RepID=A0A8H7EMX9_9FUNG|nr:hypothetical protein EC973_003710 [Apophysomyces ossiformis]